MIGHGLADKRTAAEHSQCFQGHTRTDLPVCQDCTPHALMLFSQVLESATIKLVALFQHGQHDRQHVRLNRAAQGFCSNQGFCNMPHFSTFVISIIAGKLLANCCPIPACLMSVEAVACCTQLLPQWILVVSPCKDH